MYACSIMVKVPTPRKKLTNLIKRKAIAERAAGWDRAIIIMLLYIDVIIIIIVCFANLNKKRKL